MDHDGNSLAITAADTVVTGEAPSWNWMDATGNGTLIHVIHVNHNVEVMDAKYKEIFCFLKE